MTEEKVYFETANNLKLCGILTFPRNKTAKCVVLCHGLTVDKEEDGIFTKLARKLAENGFFVFRFDFNGHGESDGNSIDMTVQNETEDIIAAFDYLKKRGFRNFGLVAASFAGGPASYFAKEFKKETKALVLWNSLIDYSSLIIPKNSWDREYWGKPAFERVEKFGFTEIGSGKFKVGSKLMQEIQKLEPWRELLDLYIPIVFVHGTNDEKVPYEDSVKYSKLVKNCSLVTIEGAEHGFHDRKEDSEKADKATVDFLLKNLN